ncbi:MAG: DUF6629 family protein [Candidatus Babeliales bacterium]
MCFSAHASFGSALFLTGMGIAALSQTRTNNQRLLALIPVLFAVQQTMEGIIWTTHTNPTNWWATAAPYVFLIIASSWSTIIPVAVWLMEKSRKRAHDMYLFIGMGVVYTSVAYIALALYPVHAHVTQHIAYTVDTPEHTPYSFLQFWYLITITVPPCIATTRHMRLFGIGTLISFIGSHAWETSHVASIWCFFAALISSLIVYVLYSNKKVA